MWAAAYTSSTEILQHLLDHGADIDAANHHGATALLWAWSGTDKIRLLISRHANVHAETDEGTTALLAAARFGNVDGMRVLLAAGADPLVIETSGIGLLAIAYSRQDVDMRRLLEDYGLVLERAEQLSAVKPLQRRAGQRHQGARPHTVANSGQA